MILEDLPVCLMSAKLEMPPQPSIFLPRRGLVARMRRLASQQVLRVSGPMGYGKTCALIELSKQLESEGLATKWIRIDAKDNHDNRFWEHVTCAFGVSEQSSGCDHLDAIRAMDAFAKEDAEAQVYLFLDGFERLNESSVLDEFIEFVGALPRNVHIVLSARILPGRYARFLDPYGQEEVSSFELSMTEEEALAFICLYGEENGIRFDSKDASAICEVANGWPQGIYFGVRTLLDSMRRGTEFCFDGSCSLVRSYFEAEFSKCVSPECADMLLATAMLERLNAELVDYALMTNGAGRRVGEALDSGLPIFPCDEKGKWYRCHGLLGSFLQGKMLEGDKAALRDTCLRMSEWTRHRHLPDEAAKYILMANDSGYIENLVQSISGLVRDERNESYLLWLCGIPSREFSGSPLLALQCAWAYNSTGHIDEAREWAATFESIARPIAAAGDMPANIIDACVRFLDMKHDGMEGHCSSALDLIEKVLPHGRTNPSIMSVIHQTKGEVFERIGEPGRAVEEYLKAQANASVDGTTHQLHFNMLNVATLNYTMGNFATALDFCRRLIELEQPDLGFEGAAWTITSLVLLEKNDLEGAKEALEKASTRISGLKNIDLYLEFVSAEAALLAALGDLDQAFEALAAGIYFCESKNMPRNTLQRAYFRQSEIASWRSNTIYMKDILGKLKASSAVEDLYCRLLVMYCEGEIFLMEGEAAKAVDKFDAVFTRAVSMGYNALAMKASVAELFLLQQMDDRDRLHNTTREVIKMSAKHGFVRSLVERGEPVRMALRDYLSTRDVGMELRAHVKRLLAQFGLEADMRVQRGIDNPRLRNLQSGELTAREREVLDLLNTGMSRKEIAEELCISFNTAKRHIANIYDKLGVNSKKQALTVAFSEGDS